MTGHRLRLTATDVTGRSAQVMLDDQVLWGVRSLTLNVDGKSFNTVTLEFEPGMLDVDLPADVHVIQPAESEEVAP